MLVINLGDHTTCFSLALGLALFALYHFIIGQSGNGLCLVVLAISTIFFSDFFMTDSRRYTRISLFSWTNVWLETHNSS